MQEIALSCECGSLKGKITGFEKTPGNHLVCYCNDCQAFPVRLNKQEVTLDSAGGTRIYQIPSVNLQITQGHENLVCLRLKEKGLIRWYAKCCNTPVCNTVSASLPIVGVIHTFIKGNIPDEVMGCVHKQGATDTIPKHNKPKISEFSITATVMRRLLWWKISGKGNPNPLFLDSGKPISRPEVISG